MTANMKKPKVTAAIFVTLIYMLAAGFFYVSRSDTLTIYENWGTELGEPQIVITPASEDSGEGRIVSAWRCNDEKYAITVQALKPGWIDLEMNADDSVSGRFVPLKADERLALTDVGSGNYSTSRSVIILTMVWLWSVTFIFISAFFRHLKYSVFSYNIGIYSGYGLMFLLISILLTLNEKDALIHPDRLSMSRFYNFLSNAGIEFTWYMLPVTFILTLGLIISNIVLWRREGRRFTNMVGTIMGLFLTCGSLVLINMHSFTDPYVPVARIQMSVFNGIGAVFLYLECMWVGSVIAALIAAEMKADCDRDYMIVLGCGMRPDGTPTPLLQGRCDAALRFDERQRKTTGKIAKFIASGGRGDDEIISEAECMKNYLVSRGIEEDRILLENRSTTTYENFQYSKELIPQDHPKIAFFTTKYHVFRSGIWARRAGFPRECVQGEGSSTKWYFWPNAFVREFAGLLASHRLKQILIILAGVTIQVALTLMFYLR